MAKFAPVAPPRILSQMPKEGGDYHLVLAHDILAHPDEYRRWRSTGQHMWDTVILDNSITELGSAVSADVIAKAADIVNATVVVLPDVYHSCLETIYNCKQALDTWPEALLKREVMIVPQGRSFGEYLYCAEAFKDEPRIHWWGIPRNMVSIPEIGTRTKHALLIHKLNKARKVHLLGFSDRIYDDVLSSQLSCVQGIDSAVPIRAASLGYHMAMTLIMPPRGDWWETATYDPLMNENAQVFRSWINGK